MTSAENGTVYVVDPLAGVILSSLKMKGDVLVGVAANCRYFVAAVNGAKGLIDSGDGDYPLQCSGDSRHDRTVESSGNSRHDGSDGADDGRDGAIRRAHTGEPCHARG